MARVLIVGGGCRGRRLARGLVLDGHAVRIVTRGEAGREAIEATGAECLIGDAGRLASLRGALEGVTVACWLLAGATGAADELEQLHGPRLRAFMGQAIDTTMRGFVYEAFAANQLTAAGEHIVRELASANAIPVRFVRADPGDAGEWLAQAGAAVGALLGASVSVRYPQT